MFDSVKKFFAEKPAVAWTLAIGIGLVLIATLFSRNGASGPGPAGPVGPDPTAVLQADTQIRGMEIAARSSYEQAVLAADADARATEAQLLYNAYGAAVTTKLAQLAAAGESEERTLAYSLGEKSLAAQERTTALEAALQGKLIDVGALIESERLATQRYVTNAEAQIASRQILTQAGLQSQAISAQKKTANTQAITGVFGDFLQAFAGGFSFGGGAKK